MPEYLTIFQNLAFPAALAVLFIYFNNKQSADFQTFMKDYLIKNEESQQKYINWLQTSNLELKEMLNHAIKVIENNTITMRTFSVIVEQLKKIKNV
jgi:hypothetical protein